MMQHIDYSNIADIYDLYVTADYDMPFFISETKPVEGQVLELTAGTGRLSLPLIEAGAKPGDDLGAGEARCLTFESSSSLKTKALDTDGADETDSHGFF